MNLFIQMEATQKQWHAEIQIGGIYARGKMINLQADSFDEAMAAVRDALKVIAPRELVALYKLDDPEPVVDPRVENLAKARAAKAARRAAAEAIEDAQTKVKADMAEDDEE